MFFAGGRSLIGRDAQMGILLRNSLDHGAASARQSDTRASDGTSCHPVTTLVRLSFAFPSTPKHASPLMVLVSVRPRCGFCEATRRSSRTLASFPSTHRVSLLRSASCRSATCQRHSQRQVGQVGPQRGAAAVGTSGRRKAAWTTDQPRACQ